MPSRVMGENRVTTPKGGEKLDKEQPAKTSAGAKTPPLPIIFEDSRVLVINKPAGLAVHEAKGILHRHTVIGILEAYYRERGVRPQLVHRIDQDTSGILLVAKNAQTARDLESALEDARSQKIYVTLVAGRLHQRSGTIEFPLPGREGRLVRARTRFHVIERFGETTLVEARIDTGRMHQIRLHFAKLGYPVVMDERHGDFAFNKRFKKRYGLKRQFLHSGKLSLFCGNKNCTWSAPLPKDLADVLDKLHAEGRVR